MQKNNLKIIRLESVDSTQTYLQNLDKEMLSEWTIVITYNQIKGKGQFENQWESEDGKNLTFSLYIKPQFILASNQFIITQFISLGVLDFLSQYISKERLFIKWPNDIYVEKNKICGILIQNTILGSEIYASICGIGININQEKFDFAPNPTSIKLETGNYYDIDDLLGILIDKIKLRVNFLEKNNIDYKEEYLANMLFYNKWHKYRYQGKEIEAKIEDVNEYGHLILKKKNGKKVSAELKEIKFLDILYESK